MEILQYHILDSEIIGVSAIQTQFSSNQIYWKCGFTVYTKQNKIEIWSNYTMDEDEKSKDYVELSAQRKRVVEFLYKRYPSVIDVENHDPDKAKQL